VLDLTQACRGLWDANPDQFFPVSATIDVAAGISSFTVTVNLNDGTSQSYDNNGNSYPLSDAIMPLFEMTLRLPQLT
jgi:hypothetical protein